MEFENLVKLINTVSDSKLTDFKYEEGDVKLTLAKKKDKIVVTAYDAPGQSSAAPAAPAAAAAEVPAGDPAESAQLSGNIIKSPLVGTFYASPSEDAAAFVAIGDTVKKGQTIAIVEAMKLMNEIESEYDGIIAEVLVENGAMVEYGQPLFRIG